VLDTEHEEQQRLDADAAEIRDEHEDAERAQDRAAPDEGEALADLARDVPRCERRGHERGFQQRGHEQEHHEFRQEGDGRDPERGGVGGDAPAERRDGRAAEERSDDSRTAVGAEVGGVRGRELVLLHEGWEHTEVRGHTPQHLDSAEEERDRVEQLEREPSDTDGKRHRRHEQSAHDIARDQQSPLVDAIDESPRERAEEDVWDHLDAPQQGGGAERVRQVEDQQGHRQARDLAADRPEADRSDEEVEPAVPERPSAHVPRTWASARRSGGSACCLLGKPVRMSPRPWVEGVSIGSGQRQSGGKDRW